MLWCSVVAVLGSAVLTVRAQTVASMWTAEDYPNPRTEPGDCGRSQPSYICDPNRLLEENEASQLDGLLTTVRRSTRCPCAASVCGSDSSGIRIAVALLKRMYSEEDENTLNVRSQLDKATDFTYALLTKWGLGRCEEEVIIFYSKMDNVFFTMTGTQAGKVLTSNVIGEISMAVRESFSPTTVFVGLEKLISEYEKVFTGEYVPKNYDVNAQAVVGGNGAGAILPSLSALLTLLLSAVLLP